MKGGSEYFREITFMKNKRQCKILDIVKMHDVETQEMLQSLLSQYGFNVTQATVSRDIKELKLVKNPEKTVFTDMKYQPLIFQNKIFLLIR